jgi:hypothetical protein
MIFNFSIEHIAAWAMMAILTIPLFSGARCCRWCGWLFMWQVLTPTRAWWFDIPLIGISFAILEWTWKKAND